MDDHDFGGWATMPNLRCTDGRTISPEAFKHQNQQQVPLVWQHAHNSVDNVLGHAVLEDRNGKGTYAYAYFNDTAAGKNAKILVEHGDIDQLSIYANRLKETSGKKVLHGNITEVSLVLSGANPGAKIDFVRLAHGDGEFETLEDEAVITSGEKIELRHAEGALEHKTFQDVYDTLNAEQSELLAFMLKQALDAKVEHSDEGVETETVDDNKDKVESDDDKDLEHKEGADTVARNVFDKTKELQHSEGGVITGVVETPTLTHAQVTTFLDTARKLGSFKEAFLEHAEDYGITNIEMLFPEARAMDTRPEFITRRMEWVEGVLNGTKKLPWSRIKSLSADLTFDTARAKGYIKGSLKKDQFFTLASRETLPKTVYKRQKLDRDDIIDITDFDIVAWLWIEIYFMMREELARAILVGDGREVDDVDKINENNIRPIAFDDVFYTDVVTVPANTTADQQVEAVLRARDAYKGSGPTAYMTFAVMTDMLLAKDLQGRRYYNSKAELASALMVNDIVNVPVMEGQVRDGGEILMIIVNLADYAVGSTKGGELTKFDDFNIDYNQYTYLLETRLSGALQSHKRAQVFIRGTGTLIVTTSIAPTFVPSTGVVTIPTTTGVTYKNQLTNATLSAGAQTALAVGATLNVVAVANTGYYLPHNFDADWSFTRPA